MKKEDNQYKIINNIDSIKTSVNLGIEILRMILSFWVITFHYAGNKNKKNYKILNTYYHVPTFMIISFYLSNKLFSTLNILKIKQRISRLLLPYIVIPILKLVILILFLHYKISFNPFYFFSIYLFIIPDYLKQKC